LGIPQITYLEEFLSLDGNGTVRVRRNVGNGWEVVEASLPLLLTVMETANKPRPMAARRVMRYKRARVEAELAAEVKRQMPEVSEEEREAEVRRRAEALNEKGLLIEQWDLDRINADLSRCGLAGSPTKVYRVQGIVLTKEGHVEIPPTEAGIRQMIHELVVDRTLG
jgi:electron transfer flavoprotein beta subunit